MSRNYKVSSSRGFVFFKFFSRLLVRCITRVEAGFVFNPEDYMYSSAIDYAGEKDLLDNLLVIKNIR
jgi:hypothetical protein